MLERACGFESHRPHRTVVVFQRLSTRDDSPENADYSGGVVVILALRTGNPFCSANERNCLRANRRARPASGIRMPAHRPSAPGVSQASWAQRQRRGHARQTSFAPSSAPVVHRSGSRAHRTVAIPKSCTSAPLFSDGQYACIVRAIQSYCRPRRTTRAYRICGWTTSVLPALDGVAAEDRSSIERIRSAALKTFAMYGTSATSLRMVAAAAGVSVGLVQHHFANKAGLIKAVDDHVPGLVVARHCRAPSGSARRHGGRDGWPGNADRRRGSRRRRLRRAGTDRRKPIRAPRSSTRLRPLAWFGGTSAMNAARRAPIWISRGPRSTRWC